MDDPFAVLGLGRLSTAEEVHAAYRQRAKACHPDLNLSREEDAQAEMIRLNVAYSEAIRILEKRDAGSPVLPNAFKVAQRLYDRGQLDSALRILNRAPERDGSWYALQGAVLLRMDEAEAAHRSFRTAVRLEPQNEEFRAGALEAAVRMRREQTPIGKVARWARKAMHPLSGKRAK